MDLKCLSLFASVILLFVGWTICDIVTTSDGKIEGTTMESRRSVTFHAFLKIPFAKPPIGDLRFKDPLPNDPWTGVLNGTEYGPACSQPEGLIRAIDIAEDCLHLNIFTENLPVNESDLKPVIVFIHGGKFEIGSAIISSPRVMMDRNIVFVTINYRMGPFGFLATGTEEAPGNAGMKDQVRALEWIKRNIVAFGGDTNRITVWGISAGAISVTALMASPMARGLFHRAIGMSGTITSQRNLTNDLMHTVGILASRLGCENERPDEIVKCLRNRTQDEITSAQSILPNLCNSLPIVIHWWPVVEPDFGQDRFLEDQPTYLFEIGNFSKMPTLIGIISDELFVPGTFHLQIQIKQFIIIF